MTGQVSLVKMTKLVRCKFFFIAVFTFTTAHHFPRFFSDIKALRY